ncbi:uncharacterized protein MELLADRAFT_113267 [Melampsora larici-populina 98AG31]|uniref:Uncharacterized protein n=1 Tax=Melampsora larici-populina (strain 98AG31 / pathotype 3-4-7) TaxID=747676 RepID=F4S9A9_MELLP|nr:uncharacterized protein MELLADRAFT_113267 [Melampsora larici-populina 98AG31]EGF98788.1 hypothetical protein MELLADRAFT_113267 [Melampsora larici-populina 98AG31]
MLSPKFKTDARRVVCKCQSHECYKGFYLDASGIKQQGIEVIPATKESHARADLRYQIMSTSLSANQDNSNLNRPAPTDEQDQLSGPLARLGLDPSRNSSDRATRMNSRSVSAPYTNFDSLRASVADRSREPEEEAEGSSSATGVPSDRNHELALLENETQPTDPDVCKATDSARQNGLREYDTSTLNISLFDLDAEQLNMY